MPIIASAKKRARQNTKRQLSNHAFLSQMRSFFKNIINFAQKGDVDKVGEYYSETQSCIDKCVKKNLIHKNNAARKKSRIAKIITELEKKGKKVKIAKKSIVQAKSKSTTKPSEKTKKKATTKK